MLQKTQHLPSTAHGTNGLRDGLALCDKKEDENAWKSSSTSFPRKYTKTL